MARVFLPATDEPAPPPDPGPGGEKVLVVDDDPGILQLVGRTLTSAGYRVQAVNCPTKALDSYHAAALEPFQLVLSDVRMPQMNGYEVLERLHASPQHRSTPVIVISAIDQMESVIRCIQLGAEDYLPKPFNPTLLRARVGAVLEKKRLRDEIDRHSGA